MYVGANIWIYAYVGTTVKVHFKQIGQISVILFFYHQHWSSQIQQNIQDITVQIVDSDSTCYIP